MHRRPLLELLSRYVPIDEIDAQQRDAILAFVKSQPQCFERSLRIGHVTGSAWLLDSSGTRVLLTHHRKLGKWLQLGGHADADPNVLAVALREAREESGIETIEPVSREIFDLDVHWIPPSEGEPGHYHYDVRFLLRTASAELPRRSGESDGLAWVTAAELPGMETDASVLRLCCKWKTWMSSALQVTQDPENATNLKPYCTR